MHLSSPLLPSNERQRLIERIQNHSLALLQQAKPLCAEHRVALPDPEIRFDLTGLAAGQAQWRLRQRPLLRFNLTIASNHEQAFLARTVPHEVAHLITAACHGRTRPHGHEWQSTMAFLGIENPSRCHDFSIDENSVRRQRRWTYHCGCSQHQLSTTRHNRIASGKTKYHCRHCHEPLRAAE